MRRSPENRQAQLTAAVARAMPNLGVDVIADHIAGLQRVSATLHTIAERQCNGHQTPSGDWDEAAAQRDEKREESAEKRARDLADKIGCKVTFQGDPRGAVVKLHIPGQPGDSFGGSADGWPVYR